MRLVRAQREAERLRGLLWSNGMNPAAGYTNLRCGRSSRRRNNNNNNNNVIKRAENSDHHPQRLAPLGAFVGAVSIREDPGVARSDPRNSNSIRHRLVGGDKKRTKGEEASVILGTYYKGDNQNGSSWTRRKTVGDGTASQGGISRSMPVEGGPGPVGSQWPSGLRDEDLGLRSDAQHLLGFGYDTASDELVARYSGLSHVAKVEA